MLVTEIIKELSKDARRTILDICQKTGSDFRFFKKVVKKLKKIWG